MNRKGFTLIELLVTIALLAIIVIISFVSINKVIEQSKVNNCKSLVSSIKSATSEYVSDNRYKRDFIKEVGGKTIMKIYATRLVEGNYLSSPILNPFDKSEVEPGKIEILITFNTVNTSNGSNDKQESTNYTFKEATVSYEGEDFFARCQ